MKHDLAHEMAQDEAIKMLAGAVASLAGKVGATDVMKVVDHVAKLMDDDEKAEPVVPASESDEWPEEPWPKEAV